MYAQEDFSAEATKLPFDLPAGESSLRWIVRVDTFDPYVCAPDLLRELHQHSPCHDAQQWISLIAHERGIDISPSHA